MAVVSGIVRMVSRSVLPLLYTGRVDDIQLTMTIHIVFSIQDWTFDDSGLMRKRMMSGNDVRITEDARWFKEGVDIESVVIGEEHL